MNQMILAVTCPSNRNVVSAVSGYLADLGCKIIDSSQFDDLQSGRLFMRAVFISERGTTKSEIATNFVELADRFDIQWNLHDTAERKRVLVFASRSGAQLRYFLHKCKEGGRAFDILGVASGDMEFQKLAAEHDVPFHHINDGSAAETAEWTKAVVEETRTDLIVLLPLAPDPPHAVAVAFAGRIISARRFFPVFEDGDDCQMAFERGVKIVGATAHYGGEHDRPGPIIEQTAARIPAASSAEDYEALCRQIECDVLVGAISAHVQHRAFINGPRTVHLPQTSSGALRIA